MKLELQDKKDSLGSNCENKEAIERWRRLLGPSKLFANIYLSSCGEQGQIAQKNIRQIFALSDTRNFGMIFCLNLK